MFHCVESRKNVYPLLSASICIGVEEKTILYTNYDIEQINLYRSKTLLAESRRKGFVVYYVRQLRNLDQTGH